MTDEKKSDMNSQFDNYGSQEIYSKLVRAGKRTYFFDVKSTRSEEMYLTITESKRRFEDSGQPVYEKHKIFLYREDFEKFVEGLTEALGYIEKRQPVEDQDSTETLPDLD